MCYDTERAFLPMRESWNDPNSHAWVAYIKQKPGSVLILIKFSTQNKFKISYENFSFDQSEKVVFFFQHQIFSSSCYKKYIKVELGFTTYQVRQKIKRQSSQLLRQTLRRISQQLFKLSCFNSRQEKIMVSCS